MGIGKNIQNGQTEPTKPILGFVGLPEGVLWYVERRSLFVAKRFEKQKINKIRFFNKLKCFVNYKSL